MIYVPIEIEHIVVLAGFAILWVLVGLLEYSTVVHACFKDSNKKNEDALDAACELLCGSTLYGIDRDIMFRKVTEEYGVADADTVRKWLLSNLDRLSDIDETRSKAIKERGF